MSNNLDEVARGLKRSVRGQSRKRVALRESQLSAVVEFALGRLRQIAPVAGEMMLNASAWKSLGRQLKERLSFVLSPTLRVEQIAMKAVMRNLSSRSSLAHEIVEEMLRDFPGIVDTIARLLAGWVDAQRELLRRLGRDERAIGKVFFPNAGPLRVKAICPGLSDPHDSGRTVTLVEFTGSRRVVYKPRSCEGEQLWFRALKWLDRNGLDCSFRIPTIIARENYAWMEYLRTHNCTDSNAIRKFYFRWGAQTALAQVLAAGDLHRENWIAVGSHPVLVDAEVIGAVQPNAGKIGSQNSRSPSALLETGLLPLTARDHAGGYVGIAPFDAAAFGRPPLGCWPRFGGKLQAPARYLGDLVRGFEATAKVFANSELLGVFFNDIVILQRRARSRYLFRASAEYARILRDSLEPSKMISRSERWRWLKQKCYATAATNSIGTAEAFALRQCDIPKFTRPARGLSRRRLSKMVAELKSSARVLRNRIVSKHLLR